MAPNKDAWLTLIVSSTGTRPTKDAEETATGHVRDFFNPTFLFNGPIKDCFGQVNRQRKTHPKFGWCHFLGPGVQHGAACVEKASSAQRPLRADEYDPLLPSLT